MAKQIDNEIEYYGIAIDLIKYEGQRLWQVFHLYLITQVLLLGSFIGTNKFGVEVSIILGITGLLLCIPWAGAYFRHSQWYIYRMRDAQDIEKNLERRFLTKDREFGFFEEIFRPMNLTGLIIPGISFVYLFFLYKINISCFYLIVLSAIPLGISLYHIYLVWKWKKDRKKD